ncbi:MAG: hypothetical protein AUG44_05340 [Actinobacteria bacterium 13_1_20CM_3_71_11]|nr:MAG: hypothetical protein AUG44_05340 [Actinobacteria bacterium 13_1_20CM_3_71_11]TML23682.1 MAG: helix-turn-helix transcriptional regulator [Actinomycetota bacterium]
MRKQRGSTACPIVYSLDIWGDPWSLVILRDVLIDNKRHYREFLGSPERIATNVLSSRLQSLVKAGLLTKTEGPNRAQISYRPTRKALDLLPAILAIMHWGVKYNPNTDISIPPLRELEENDDKLRVRLLAQFRDIAD